MIGVNNTCKNDGLFKIVYKKHIFVVILINQLKQATYYLILNAKMLIIIGFPTLPFALSHGKGID